MQTILFIVFSLAVSVADKNGCLTAPDFIAPTLYIMTAIYAVVELIKYVGRKMKRKAKI